MCFVATEGTPMNIKRVLFYNVWKSRKMLDVGCVVREGMQMDIECV